MMMDRLLSSSILFPGMSLNFDGRCRRGVRAHNQRRFVECGLGDNANEIKCNEAALTCRSVDLWIEGIEDKPLTYYYCGADGKSVTDKDDGKCISVCEEKRFEAFKKGMKSRLTNYTVEKNKLTEECLKDLSKISSISESHWTKTKKDDDGFDKTDVYCADIKQSQNCAKAPATEDETNGEEEETANCEKCVYNCRCGKVKLNGATKMTFSPIGNPNIMLLSIINSLIGTLIMSFILV